MPQEQQLMSLPVSITTALLSVMIVGCASVARVDTTAVESINIDAPAPVVADSTIYPIIREPIQVTECERTQRDLTADWLSRQYLCSHGKRRVALQQYNDGGHLLHRRKVGPLLSDTADIAMSSVTPAIGSSSSPHEMVQYHVASPTVKQHSVQAQSQTPVKSSGNKEVVTIAFDENREVLNQAGIDQSLSLVTAANDARRITLLGVYEQAEIDAVSKIDTAPQKHERFSVGRALSIRKLWEQEGVDLSKIMIKHHREHRSGRYVEVVFYD